MLTSKYNFSSYFIISLILLTVFFIYYFFFGEILSVNEGLGFDGLTYAQFIQDLDLFVAKADSMSINRILPAAFLKLLFSLLSIKATPANIVSAFQILNFLFIAGALFLWNTIIGSKANQNHFLFSVTGLLISFGVLKFSFFYSPLTDTAAFFLAVWLLSAYLNEKKISLLIISFLGMFTLPLITIMSLTLFSFPKTLTLEPDYKNKRLKMLFSASTAFGFTGLSAFLIHGSPDYRGVSTSPVSHLMSQLTIPSLLITFFLFFFGFYFMVKMVNIRSVTQKLFAGLTLKLIASSFFILIALFLCTKFLISHYHIKSGRPFTNYFINILVTGNRYPLGNIISHLVYFGPLFIIAALKWKSICEFAYTKSLGLYLILIQLFIYSFDAESRHIITYLPFLVYFVVSILNLEVKSAKPFILCFVIIAVFYARILVNVNTFPTQDSFYNYCLNTALLFDDRAFIALLLTSVVVFVIFYFLEKRIKHGSIR